MFRWIVSFLHKNTYEVEMDNGIGELGRCLTGISLDVR